MTVGNGEYEKMIWQHHKRTHNNETRMPDLYLDSYSLIPRTRLMETQSPLGVWTLTLTYNNGKARSSASDDAKANSDPAREVGYSNKNTAARRSSEETAAPQLSRRPRDRRK